MGNFAAQPQGQHPLFALLQMLMQMQQQQMKPQMQAPSIAQQGAQQPQAKLEQPQGMPPMPQMFTPPRVPNYGSMMQPAGSFVGQAPPEMKAITAMKPPANPWLPKAK